MTQPTPARLTPQGKSGIHVLKQPKGRMWGIYGDTGQEGADFVLIEGGFFTRDAADAAAAEYRKKGESV